MTQHTATAPLNRLQYEKSPYLLQHAENPVAWHPWGPEAFEKARAENKPIFLSIGYSTCHWCHVMAHESFEDPQIAELMNAVFVSIKVDREERPDLDNIYMTVCQLLTGSGGWPLTIIMTPDKRPFYAGTYFPKTSRFGRIGMADLIPQIQQIWTTEHEKALRTADQVVDALEKQTVFPASTRQETPAIEGILHDAYTQLVRRFDARHGGFGAAPKFPTPHNLSFLLRYWKRNNDETALSMVERTLQAMQLGGMYDHIGFGFHRYSTDERWLLPHFEKMLYDQALLSMTYLEAYQATGKETYARVAREIFTYVLRDMTSPEGGFYSAEDADSEGVEGKFYVWSAREIQELFEETDADLILKLFNFESNGNFRDQATGLKTGENIVYLRQSVEKTAVVLQMSEEALRQKLEQIRQRLFEVREQRIHPHKDDKILTDWNGLMIAALARGAQILDEPDYAHAAQRAMQFIFDNLRREDGGLLHRYRDSEAAILANVDDYAFLIWGLIELYETTFATNYLKQALAFNAEMIAHFWDAEAGGFYFTADDAETLLVRQKELYDGAIPSGNSVAMLNLLRLGRLTAQPELEERAQQLFQAFAASVTQSASNHAQLMHALDFAAGPTQEIVIVGRSDAEDPRVMLQALRTTYTPNSVVVLRPAEEELPEILQLAPYITPYVSLDGKATAYICRNYVCSLPATDVNEMLTLLN
ncbi:hypothetical protein U27_02043 [Candidatus Vecturithrix granuli]|uniref:Spermatogenesis-associated protein 20-like TRX domain-containing protein n=1 Tax=Vecturithrix granuli TaxID=1499967 RepID=A0A0S6W9Q8_VECG1|nr:hypothetical protein U27_02043 [Candidatus Vecturithrix granuli]